MLHPERRLGYAGIIEHQSTNDVRLKTCATISGRVVSHAGKPAAKTWVSAAVADSEFPDSHDQLGWRYMVRSVRSDENGRFELDMILPGVRYKIHSSDGATADVDVVKPGASIDVGSLTATKPDEPGPAAEGAAEKAVGSALRPRGDTTTKVASGTVLTGNAQTSDKGKTTGHRLRASARPPSGSQCRRRKVEAAGVTILGEVEFGGSVTDANGKPVAGAEIWFVYFTIAGL